ncbi:hypothetical protein [Desulfurispora thermophila]|uniref:hypothetical protein n=1 Tax=Desulfurispora thermophila TaxID=265470 RepID=UPI000360D5B0|nr:hypothetical protein [Desulfurispora thermophila]
MEKIEKQVTVLALLEKMQQYGSWCGETHLQKCLYFLQELLKVPVGYQYVLYKHGPYSFDLHDEITEMRAKMFLELRPRQYPYGPSIVPGKIAGRLKELYAEPFTRYAGQIDYVAQKLAVLGVAKLEQLATSLYVTLKNPAASLEERACRVVELKPHVDKTAALEAVQLIDEMQQEVADL